MRKFLVTTALASMVAGSAFAGDVAVNLGGSVDFELGKSSQKSAYKTTSPVSQNQKSVKMRNRAKLHVAAKGKADNGVMYGANARIATNAEQANTFDKGAFDKTYIWVESSMGRVEMGSNYGASKLLKVGAESVAVATGGASDGNWSHYVGLPEEGFITSGDAALNRTALTAESSRKITFLSPRYSGMQFGVSYAPDNSNKGDQSTLANPTNNVKNVWNFAANYANTFNDVNVALSLTHEIGKATDFMFEGEAVPLHKLKSTTIGAAAGKDGVTVAASYGKDGKSLFPKDTTKATSKFYTAGVSYETGPFATSLTYLNSKFGSEDILKTTAYSIGLDYKVAPGFKTFAEVNFFNLKSSDATVAKNKGTVVLLGTKVSF